MTDHRITGLAEVARLCGVSLSTVNRKVGKLRDFGAEKDSDGVWHVPVTAIEGVGWKIKADMPRHATPDMPVTRSDMSPETLEIRAQLDSLREELATLRGRLVAAEAAAEKWQMIAAERLQNLDDLRLAQRLLEARNVEPAPEQESTPAPAEPEQPAIWFGRFRRMRGHG
ncbi:hypothetical protein EVU97_14820 [Dermacoccus sp. 147Ba]|uniref:hypothetical protein n=1 Tax=Dermacoccus sp. 147Ba TaxID=2510111 RepID=UPI00101D5B5B|nr:hypothetical protein [Dermacoccus sp. 147Ba]RYI20324.1 hypothetical protein EVU97_14820 [Dermacoccus sp. 147Ba]